jgi:hypothetical protein
MVDKGQVWDILLDWSLSKSDVSFKKKVNWQSLDKVSKDFVTFSFPESVKFQKFLKYFTLNSKTYSKISGIEIFVNNYNRAKECENFGWISQILSLPNLVTLRICDCDWIHESLFQKVDSPLCLMELELRGLPLTGKCIENLLGFTPFLVDLKLSQIRMVI